MPDKPEERYPCRVCGRTYPHFVVEFQLRQGIEPICGFCARKTA